MKTEKDNVLTTEEEIQKAIAEELGEEITKGEEGGEGAEGDGGEEGETVVKAKGSEGEEEEEESDSKTNAKVEGEEKEEEEEEEESEKGKMKKSEGSEESDDDLQKAIDAAPIMKAFSETQDIILQKLAELKSDIATMRKNNAIVSKGLTEKVAKVDEISKAVEEIHAFGTQRKTFGAAPIGRFEKGEGGENEPTVLYSGAAQHRDKVIEVMEKAIFDDGGNLKNGAVEKGLVNSLRSYSAAGIIDKGMWQNEFAKNGFILQ